MASLKLNVGGRSYVLDCEEKDLPHVQKLGNLLDERVKVIARSAPGSSDSRILMITALMLLDELEQRENLPEPLPQAMAESGKVNEEERDVLNQCLSEVLLSMAERVEGLAKKLEKV